MDANFIERAKAASTPLLSKDVWSNNAADMVRIAIFAGFDAHAVIFNCLVKAKGQRITLPTVERVLTDIYAEGSDHKVGVTRQVGPKPDRAANL